LIVKNRINKSLFKLLAIHSLQVFHQPPHPDPLVNEWDAVGFADLHGMAGAARSGIGQIIVENPKGGGLDVFGSDGLNGIPQDISRLDGKTVMVPGHKAVNKLLGFLVRLGLVNHFLLGEQVDLVQSNRLMRQIGFGTVSAVRGNHL